MNSLYYTVELMIIAAVPILNSIGIKVPYWSIALILLTNFIQMMFMQAQMNAAQSKTEEMMKLLNKTQQFQKDIMNKQKDLKNDVYLGGYN